MLIEIRLEKFRKFLVLKYIECSVNYLKFLVVNKVVFYYVCLNLLIFWLIKSQVIGLDFLDELYFINYSLICIVILVIEI